MPRPCRSWTGSPVSAGAGDRRRGGGFEGGGGAKDWVASIVGSNTERDRWSEKTQRKEKQEEKTDGDHFLPDGMHEHPWESKLRWWYGSKSPP